MNFEIAVREHMGSMATEIVLLQNSILDSFHTHLRQLSSLATFLVPCAHTVSCITFLYTRSFSYLSLLRLVNQPDITFNTTYTLSTTANFFKHTPASFAYDHSWCVVCDAAQPVQNSHSVSLDRYPSSPASQVSSGLHPHSCAWRCVYTHNISLVYYNS